MFEIYKEKDNLNEAIEFNHGDKVKTTDGSGHRVVLSHDGKEYPIAQSKLVKESLDEAVVNYSLWSKFDKLIPHDMRFKEYNIVDGHILHWITQEYFDEFDLQHFYDVFEDFFNKYNSGVDTALVIPRDETQWNYYKDFNKSKGAYMTIEDGPVMWNESFEINRDVVIPGTNILLEKGDKVHLISKKNESNSTTEIIFEDANFEFITYMNTDVYDYTYKTYNVKTKRNSKADSFVIEIRISKAWKTWEPEYIEIAYGLPGAHKSITEFIRVLQDSMKFADKVASYLKVKVINK